MYCGPPSIGLKHIVLHPISMNEWLGNRSFIFLHKARCGLGLLCQHWKLSAGDEVLVPAYNCGTEIDPFIHYGLDVAFYRVDHKANIDFEDIKQRVTQKTKVIYITHYFGWPQDIKMLSAFCMKNRIYLIEDCALSLFSHPARPPIGELGDAVIYSFPKTLPVPDGGALKMSRDSLREITLQSPQSRDIFNEMLPLIKRSILRFSDRVGLYSYLPRRLTQKSRRCNMPLTITPAGLSEIPQSYYYDKNIQNMTASAMTRFLLKHMNPEAVVQHRRANYTQLYEAIKDSSIFKPLYDDLPEGVCPLYMPVVVEDRKSVSAHLNRKGISAIQWWSGFHRAFDCADFPEAKYLKEQLLVIPIHQQLNRRNIDYIASFLKKGDVC